MDDVLADATGQFINFYKKDFGVQVSRQSLNGKEERERFPDHHEVVNSYVFQKDFFRTMAVNENSQEVVERLNKKYEIFIVSSAMEFPQSLNEKLEWLNEHFPFLHWKQFVFCGEKSVVFGDYMIDDLPRNLETFNSTKLLFTAPHNLQFNQFKRVNNWKEIGEMFL
jgi:5'(3')-deoxyribonucleotidase